MTAISKSNIDLVVVVMSCKVCVLLRAAEIFNNAAAAAEYIQKVITDFLFGGEHP